MVKPMREAVMKGGRQNESGRRAEIGTEIEIKQAFAGALCQDSGRKQCVLPVVKLVKKTKAGLIDQR